MKEIISITILSIFLYICFKLMLQSMQIDYKENLTMEEKPIKITIENYKNETKVYEIPQSAQIDIYTVHVLEKGDVVLNAGPIVGMSIEVEVADDKPIKIIEEDI